MPLKIGTKLAQGQEVVHWKVTSLRQGRIVNRCGVALGEDELIAPLPHGFLGTEAHDLEEQSGDDVRVREGPPRMARLSGVGHLDDVAAEDIRFGLQHLDGPIII
jgi:hypothetical protein